MLQSIDHINIVVCDLDRMAEFYTSLLGLTPTRRVTIEGPWIDRTVGLVGVRAEVIYLDLPQGPRVELIRYHSPAGGARPAGIDNANTAGLRHMAFRVRDIDGMVARLRDAGIAFLGDVQTVPSEQVTYAGGARKHLIYFRDPEGNLLELCEYK